MATLQQIISSLPVGKTNAMKVAAFENAIGNQPGAPTTTRPAERLRMPL